MFGSIIGRIHFASKIVMGVGVLGGTLVAAFTGSQVALLTAGLIYITQKSVQAICEALTLWFAEKEIKEALSN